MRKKLYLLLIFVPISIHVTLFDFLKSKHFVGGVCGVGSLCYFIKGASRHSISQSREKLTSFIQEEMGIEVRSEEDRKDACAFVCAERNLYFAYSTALLGIGVLNYKFR